MSDIKYNLVLMHMPNFQHIGDFLTIRNILIGIAPEIRTIIASLINNKVQLPENAINVINSSPTLVFSPTPNDLPKQFRGTRLVCERTNKWREYQLLEQHDLPYPTSHFISSLDDLDELDLGERFVIKPNVGRQGEGVMLVEAPHAKEVVRSKFGSSGLTLVAQKAINTGPFPVSYRAFTVLGRVVYATQNHNQALDVEGSMAEHHCAPIAANAHVQGRTIALTYEADVLELAARVHESIPHLPVLGLDMVRDISNGQLYCLELNSSGWTWHLSSNFGAQYRKDFALDYYGQFNALQTIAEALAHFTREKAS